MTKCLLADCEEEAAVDSPVCIRHKGRLQKAEAETLRAASNSIRNEMRQFERLLYIEPPLHSAEIAHRMVWPLKEVRKMLKKFKDDRL